MSAATSTPPACDECHEPIVGPMVEDTHVTPTKKFCMSCFKRLYVDGDAEKRPIN